MKNFFLSLIFIVFSCQSLFSQGLEGKQVALRAFTSVNGTEFFVKTVCYKDSIKINFKVKDSLSYKDLQHDHVYKTLMKSFQEIKQFDSTNDTIKQLLTKIDSVTLAYTSYHTDSVLIANSSFSRYSKLLSDLFKSSPGKLEDPERIKNRIILDGTSMTFKFSQNDLLQFSAYAHSPNKESHPLLYDYVKSTLDIYRNIRKDTFLTKEKTSGY
jgi:hypothetical protein